jgi:hypothetical protein
MNGRLDAEGKGHAHLGGVLVGFSTPRLWELLVGIDLGVFPPCSHRLDGRG